MKLAAAATVATALAAATPAHAQPALTPALVPAGPREPAHVANQDEEKSGSTALLLSLGGAVGSLALTVVGANMENGSGASLMTVGVLSSIITPSFGHWYAGEYWTAGLGMRAGGGIAFVAGAAQAFGCIDAENSCDDGAALVLVGAGLYIGGTLYDIATAPSAAERWNEKHLQLAPTVVSSGTHQTLGLGLGGAF